jgi:hypothetical protein
MTIEELKELKSKIETAKEQKNKTEGAKEQMLKQLKDEFGLDSIDQIDGKIDGMKKEIDTLQTNQNKYMEEIEQEMEKAE